jgi:hypothetical protein
MKGSMWAAVITVSLMTGTMILPRDSEACCFYNKTDDNILVRFVCTESFCNDSVWDLKPGDHACRPGKAGYAEQINRHNRKGKEVCFDIKVARHGWVEIHHVSSPNQGMNKGVVESKDEHGNTTQACMFDWK